ncbi:LGFP repeat protein [Corynebacterium occultum]|uniref:LGFP repeat protein n=1 Tax=Corynebacterium occultum TaxID=2675219 RepID=A0A6B8VUW8_9CORY|nr:hypothetical protein [Corynebacterium occultum]QGU06879.1 LGFP repeat protein [Corynebacterium occultum]
MSLERKTLRRRILAGAAALTLSLSVVACSDAEEATGTAGDALSSATDAAGSAIDEATGGADSPDETTEPGEEGSPGETTEVESADGEPLEVPAAVLPVAEQAGFGAPTEVEEGAEGQTLVSFEEGYVVNSVEGGAQSLVGMIAETWIDEGGLDSDVGVPVAPEEANAEGNGWTQEFNNGTISWADDGSGEFVADIQSN